MPTERPPEPWLSLLDAMNEQLSVDLDLVCIGGFALTVVYGAPRTTIDLDVLWARLGPSAAAAVALAERGGKLHQALHVYVDCVTVATPPCGYARRLRPIFRGAFSRLRMFVPDACDLALLKLERNSQRDREDVKWLARVTSLDIAELRCRYTEELRPYLTGPVERHDLTLKLWIEMIEPERRRRT